MISNEHPSPNYRRPYQKPYQQPHQGHHQPYGNYQPRPPVQEDSLKSAELEIERKSFRLMLKENPRGRFVRITESNGTKFNSIMVPESGLADFLRIVNEMVALTDGVQPDSEPPPTPNPEVPVAIAEEQIQVAAAPEPEPEPAPVKKSKVAKLKTSTKAKAVPKKAKVTRKAKA